MVGVLAGLGIPPKTAASTERHVENAANPLVAVPLCATVAAVDTECAILCQRNFCSAEMGVLHGRTGFWSKISWNFKQEAGSRLGYRTSRSSEIDFDSDGLALLEIIRYNALWLYQ